MDNTNLGMNKKQAKILCLIGQLILVFGIILLTFTSLSIFKEDSLIPIGVILINIGIWIFLYTEYFYGITNYPKWFLKILVWGNCVLTFMIIIMIIIMVILPLIR